MSDTRRCDMQPALYKLANHFCCTDLTDGFCSPANKDECECWKKAERWLATGLSVNACIWVDRHRKRIEEEAGSNKRTEEKP